MKEVRNNIAIYSHALPRIRVIGGQRSVRIAPPSLPPHHSGPEPGTSSPPSRLKRSSTGVICMCKASFTNNSCPLPWSSTVVSSQWEYHHPIHWEERIANAVFQWSMSMADSGYKNWCWQAKQLLVNKLLHFSH